MPYKITHDETPLRAEIRTQLFGLDLVSEKMREGIVTAWISSVSSSAYDRLQDVPWDPSHTSYRLLSHVNEVTRAGIGFAKLAAKEWGHQVNDDILVPILILHDVDKPLLFAPRGSETVHSKLYRELPHGVIGGMLLKELGFDHSVVSVVATHSPMMPFRGETFEAFVLFYADHFCCDNELLRAGKQPVYQRLQSR